MLQQASVAASDEDRVWVLCGNEDFYVDIKREEASVGMSGRIPVGTPRSPRVARKAVVLSSRDRAVLRSCIAKVNYLMAIGSKAEVRDLQARIRELTA